jgi:hypothetical protein
VTLDIRLANSSEDRVLVTKLDLRFTHFEQSAVKFASETLEPHGSLSVTQEVTITKREYQLWQSGVRPYLLLTVQIGANQETTLTLALLRRPG